MNWLLVVSIRGGPSKSRLLLPVPLPLVTPLFYGLLGILGLVLWIRPDVVRDRIPGRSGNVHPVALVPERPADLLRYRRFYRALRRGGRFTLFSVLERDGTEVVVRFR